MLLDADDSQLVLVDYQARLMPAIFEGDLVAANALRLARMAKLLQVPVFGTVQNPDGLGPLLPELQAAIEAASGKTLAKMHFNAVADGLGEWLRPPVRKPPQGGNARSLPKHLQRAAPEQEEGRASIVIAGCEAHVCLMQTALGLLEEDFEVWVVTDACSSRSERNRDAAFDRLAGAGAELVTTEMVAFEWLGTAEHPAFKDVLGLVNKELAMDFLPRWFLSCCVAAVTCLASGCAVSQTNCDPRSAASPQADGKCGFSNMANPDAKPSQTSWKIWSRFLTANKQGTVPVDAIPVRKLDKAALAALDPAANHIVRLGHSSHLLKLRGKYWLIDPVFSERVSPVQWLGPKRFHAPPLPLTELPDIEGLILSHDHYDHLDTATIEYLLGKVQRYFVPLGVGKRLRDMGVAPDRIEEFDWWQKGRFGEIELTAAPSQHFSGRTLSDRNSTLWASWVIQSGSERIYYSGDSGYFPGFKQIGERLGGFDIALMENGAYDDYWPSVHMSPEETVKAFQDLRGKLLYLVHNSTFDLAFHTWRDPLDRVAALTEKQGIPLATPEIGEVLTLGKPRTNVLWWKSLR